MGEAWHSKMVWNFGHIIEMNKNDFVKRMNESKIEGNVLRESPLAKWINRVY